MKPWYTSKTLWLNLIAVTVLLLQTRFGFVIEPEAQAGLLAVINIVLRAVTKAPLDWASQSASVGNPEAGFIRLPLLFILATFACLIAMTGCATTTAGGSVTTPLQVAGKSLLAVKSTIVTAATATDALCKIGTIGAEKCAQAKTAYGATKPAYDIAMQSYLLMSSTGGNPADFEAALLRVQNLAASLLLITGGAQ